jgi:hypothetical protein
MRTIALGTLVAATAVAVAPGASTGAAAPRARTSLSPRTHLFGAPVTATLELQGARAAHVTAQTSFAPYRIVQRAVTEHAGVVAYTFRLECLQRECLSPAGTEREVVFPPVEVRVAGRSARLEWPALHVASRLSPRDVARGELRAVSDAPPPSYRVNPALVGWSLAVLAALLTLAAALLGRRLWLPARTARTVELLQHPTPLDYALTLVAVTAGAGEQERREALDALAVVLEEHGLRRLARRARTLAWSRQAPAHDAARRLADEARAGVGGRQ